MPAAVERPRHASTARRGTQRDRARDAHGRGDAGYLPRLWAQRHIAALLLAKHEPVVVPPCAREQPCQTAAEVRDARDEVLRKEIVELGKQYFLLSRHTSLLVLENDAMYAQYGVAKGNGATWAPYAMPATIPATTGWVSPVPPPGDLGDVEVVRRPLVPTTTETILIDGLEPQWYARQQAIREARMSGMLSLDVTSAPDGAFASLTGTGEIGDSSGRPVVRLRT